MHKHAAAAAMSLAIGTISIGVGSIGCMRVENKTEALAGLARIDTACDAGAAERAQRLAGGLLRSNDAFRRAVEHATPVFIDKSKLDYCSKTVRRNVKRFIDAS